MRKLEHTTLYADGWRDEWAPFPAPDGAWAWSDADFARFVRAYNLHAKRHGDNTRLRSVEDNEG